MKRHTPPIPARRAAIAILIVGFFFASAFYRCGTPSPAQAPPSPAPAPAPAPSAPPNSPYYTPPPPAPTPAPAYDPDQGRDPTMESSTTTSYAGQDQQGAAVNCGMVHGGSLVNGVCYHGSSNTGSGSANQIGDADVYGAIANVAEAGTEAVADAVETAVDHTVCSDLGQHAISGAAGVGTAVVVEKAALLSGDEPGNAKVTGGVAGATVAGGVQNGLDAACD